MIATDFAGFDIASILLDAWKLQPKLLGGSVWFAGGSSRNRLPAAFRHQEIDQTAHHLIVGPADQGRGVTLLGDKPTMISVFR